MRRVGAPVADRAGTRRTSSATDPGHRSSRQATDRDGGWQPWAQLLADAAEATNTAVKLSGLNTAAAPGASPADYQRYVDHALDVFGPERTMYGGDWPFALLAANSYTEIWRDLRACLNGLDHAERHAVLAGTAQRVYRLSIPTLTATR